MFKLFPQEEYELNKQLESLRELRFDLEKELLRIEFEEKYDRLIDYLGLKEKEYAELEDNEPIKKTKLVKKSTGSKVKGVQ